MDEGSRLRIFLSYSRADGAQLADELAAGLELLGFVPIMDKRDIAAAEDWQGRLESLIRQADTVVFLLSPRSALSPRCAWEVDRAVTLSKRIVPAVTLAVPEADVPEPLRRLNFIDFGPGQSFVRSLGRLADALRVDLAWIREHTRLAGLAERWGEGGRDDAQLLRGAELDAAQSWIARWHVGAPAPTDAQRTYVAASAEAAALRDSDERKRLEELALANRSRAEALQQRELALRSLRRRTLVGGAAAAVLSLGLSFTAAQLVRSARERETLRKRADDASAQSLVEAARREALRTDLEGQVVAYAASAGQNAMDDSGFTSGLLGQLASEQVPLGVALSRTVKKVIEKTNGSQRPYIATDMNGDVYFKLAPPSRLKRALVISIDSIGDMDLPGVRADAAAWNAFLLASKFDVQWLRNPKRDEVIAALYSTRVAAVGVPATMTRPVGAGGPWPMASPGSSAQARRDPPAPRPNTFFALYFAGEGVLLNGLEYLAMADIPIKADVDAKRAASVSVRDITKLLRERFAASCLIFDTQFHAAH